MSFFIWYFRNKYEVFFIWIDYFPFPFKIAIPLSVAKRYATSKYGGQTESDALTNFMTDMMSPEINAAGNNQMETQQTNVPPGNEPQGLMTSPQNMETV